MSAITITLKAGGAHHRFPQIYIQDKGYMTWTGNIWPLLQYVGKVTWTTHLKEKMVPLIVRNLHYSIDHNWIRLIAVGGSWIDPAPSKYTMVKHEWSEGMTTALDHLYMERQNIWLGGRMFCYIAQCEYIRRSIMSEADLS